MCISSLDSGILLSCISCELARIAISLLSSPHLTEGALLLTDAYRARPVYYFLNQEDDAALMFGHVLDLVAYESVVASDEKNQERVTHGSLDPPVMAMLVMSMCVDCTVCVCVCVCVFSPDDRQACGAHRSVCSCVRSAQDRDRLD